MSYLITGATITQQKLNNAAIVAKTGNYTAVGTDDIITGTGSWTLTLYAAARNQDGALFQRPLIVANLGAGTITVSRGGTDTFADGTTSFLLLAGQAMVLIPDGVSKWFNLGALALGQVLSAPELKNYVETFTSPAIATGVLTVDLLTGCEFAVALNANITTLTISNVPSTTKVTTLTIKFTADGTLRTITWPASFHWAGGTAPTMTSTNTKVDIITARTYDGGTTWYPALYGQNL